MTLLLYRWHLDAAGRDPPAERRRVVDTVVVPVFQDAAILGMVECIYAGKYGRPTDPDEVRLTLVVEEGVAIQAIGAVAVHLGGERVTQLVGPTPGDALCRARAAWYRARLTDVTRIALDMDGDPAHRAALLAMWNPSGASDAQLGAYFSTHSPVYRELCNTDDARAAFWKDFWRNGPGPGLSHPGHWVEDLVLAE